MTLLRVLILCLLQLPMASQAAGLFLPVSDRAPLLQQGRPLIQRREGAAPGGGASLFAGTRGGSLFEPVIRQMQQSALPTPGPAGSVHDHIRDVIALAEAGPAGYDAVQHGARKRPRKRPTDMTIGEIYDWIARTPGQPHAIGRYQFVPGTLRALVRRAGFKRNTRFSPLVQDHLANMLLDEAGLPALQAGEMTPRAFMHNLAGIWAGLPTPSGKSRYHGYAGNKATMSWARFEREMAPVFR